MNALKPVPNHQFDQGRPYANSVVEANSKQLPERLKSRERISNFTQAQHPYYSNMHAEESRPIKTPTISEKNCQQDLQMHSGTSNKPMNLKDSQANQKIEHEDDTGKIQQVSGGFGDSNAMDADTMRILKENQQKVNEILAKLTPMDDEAWEQQAENEDYTMESNIFDYNELKKSEHFGIKVFKDAIYRGELINGKRVGRGVMLYRKCRLYEGYWAKDERHGKGMERYSNGNRYEGDFAKNKPDGKGIYAWVNGEVYEGEWKIGLKEGQGIWKGIFGDSYIGQWVQSKADGYGVHQWKNGDRYEGEWKDCLKHGQGTDIFAMGDVYTGQYQFGKPHGFGQYKWKNQSSYAGEFQHGLKHGKGKWRKRGDEATNCNRYDGEYQDDKKSGMGTFIWESGNQYRGCYKNDERHGYGEMTWIDGSCYKGEWSKGIQHGIGRMEFPDGRVKEGLFENNVFKQPITDTPQLKQMKAQELLMKDPALSSQDGRLKSRERAGRTIIASSGEREFFSPERLNALQTFENSALINKISMKRPDKLNPVVAPRKRDLSNGSDKDSANGSMVSGLTGFNQQQSGYASGGIGTDTESARLSNVQTYKYNPEKPPNGKTIQKIAPTKPKDIAPSSKFVETATSSNNRINRFENDSNSSALPGLKNKDGSPMTTLQSGSIGGARKASPEAINLLLLQQQNAQMQKTKIWKPSGGKKETSKERSVEQRKLFF